MFTWLINRICYGAFTILWTLVRLILIVLDQILNFFFWLAYELPSILIIGIKPGGSFSNFKVPGLMIGFLMFLVISFIFILLIAMAKIRSYDPGKNEQNPVKVALKFSVVSLLWLISIPVVIYVISTFMNFTFRKIVQDENGNIITRSILNSLYLDHWEEAGLSKGEWLSIEKSYYHISFDKYVKFSWGDGPLVIFSGTFIVLCAVIPIFLIMTMLVEFIFQLLILYAITPLVAGSSMLDNGYRIKEWNRMFFSKSVMIYFITIAVSLLGFFMQFALNAANALSPIPQVRILVTAALIAGASIATLKVTELAGNLLGESTKVRGNMSSFVRGLKARAKMIANPVAGAASTLKNKLGSKMNNAKNKLKNGIRNTIGGGATRLSYLDKRKALKAERKAGKLGYLDYKRKGQALRNQYRANKHEQKMNMIKAKKDRRRAKARNEARFKRRSQLFDNRKRIYMNDENNDKTNKAISKAKLNSVKPAKLLEKQERKMWRLEQRGKKDSDKYKQLQKSNQSLNKVIEFQRNTNSKLDTKVGLISGQIKE